MDDADRANIEIERGLESAISAARGIKPRWRTHCVDCGEHLEEHRRQYGMCILCKEQEERLKWR